MAARFCAARPLGAGRCRYTWQNHHRGNGNLDSGTVRLQTGICDRRCAGNFEVSARLGESDFFVIEADEYDCAFFDKRSKFVHYCPRTLILNNLEFDHADIFDDLKAIQKQFHHLVRIVPGQGRIIWPENDINLKQTMAMGCWSEQELVGEQGHWQAKS